MAQIYYVKNGGNDNAAGTNDALAWATLSKVNSFPFAAGDSVLFKRGSTWYGTLNITRSGNATNRITYGSYDTGNKPIITGFTTLSGFNLYSGSIYSKAVAAQDEQIESVLVDGVFTKMGQYPNNGSWNTIDSHSGTSSITDNQLASSPSYTGAEAIIRSWTYVIDRVTVSSHSGTTLNHSGTSFEPENGNGYYLINSINTLTTTNEWYYNGTTFYIYGDPSAKTVKVATLNNAVVCYEDYITFDNIKFEGFNGTALDFYSQATQPNNITVTNCEIAYVGGGAIHTHGHHITIDNNYIHNINGTAVSSETPQMTLTNNIVEDIGMYTAGDGFVIEGTDFECHYNSLKNIAGFGIYTQGIEYMPGGWRDGDYNFDVSYNRIENAASFLSDCGAIYTTYCTSAGTRNISDNIILDITGDMDSYAGSFDKWVTTEGIYIDEPSSDITIQRNTVSGVVNGCGIKFHEAHEITVSHNLIYNCKEGFQYQGDNSHGEEDAVRNIASSYNKVIAMPRDYSYADNENQFYHNFYSFDSNIDLFGTGANNIYARPLNDGVGMDFHAYYGSWSDNWKTFSAWKTVTGQDATSSLSTVYTDNVSNVHFRYNDTNTSKTYNISGTLRNVAGITQPSSVTLDPFESFVFIGTGSVTEVGAGVPTLSTTNVTNILSTSALGGGNTISDNGNAITSKGVCWSTSQNPTIVNSKTTDGSGTGNFTSSITGLTATTTYYVRAYATNSVGTGYGSQVSFTTSTTLTLPSVTTGNATNISYTSVTLNATLNSNGGDITNLIKGFVLGLTPGPTVSSNYRLQLVSGTSPGAYSASITALPANTILYYRAYAINAAGGPVYGAEFSFATYAYQIPTLTTTALTSITQTSASSGGTITSDGGDANITAKGVCWATTLNPTILNNKTTNGTGSSAYTSSITGLTVNTTYYVRSYATNSAGTGYGNQLSFTTGATLPTIMTIVLVYNLTSNSATADGYITSDGGSPITAKGACWSTVPNPTIADSKTMDGTGTDIFYSHMTGLTPSTTYYYRTYATNSVGTAYSDQDEFTTYALDTWIGVANARAHKAASFNVYPLLDKDGNIYTTVTIGNQEWIVENLKTTKYADGTAIPAIDDSVNWTNDTSGAMCWYDDNRESYENDYGALYNKYAVDNVKGLVYLEKDGVEETGWRIPTTTDIAALEAHLQGNTVAGGKLKEIGTTHWASPNTGATNESGFTARGSGIRTNVFGNLNNIFQMWLGDLATVNFLQLYNSLEGSYSYFNISDLYKYQGMSVRLVRDI